MPCRFPAPPLAHAREPVLRSEWIKSSSAVASAEKSGRREGGGAVRAQDRRKHLHFHSPFYSIRMSIRFPSLSRPAATTDSKHTQKEKERRGGGRRSNADNEDNEQHTQGSTWRRHDTVFPCKQATAQTKNKNHEGRDFSPKERPQRKAAR
jgi:hypothetical protein